MNAPTIPVAAQRWHEGHITTGGDGPNSHGVQLSSDDHRIAGVVGPNFPDPVHMTRVGHRCVGGVGDPSTVNAHVTDGDQHSVGVDGPTPTSPPIGNPEAMLPVAGSSVSSSPAAPTDGLNAKVAAAALVDPFLDLAAVTLDDLEKVRIANENRLRQLTRTEADVDGEERGFGLDESHPDVAKMAALVAELAKAEHQAELQLARKMRAHPLGPWVKATAGVGEKQGARLLAAIGDPAWHHRDDRPRTLRELWSYCGYGDASVQVRRRGERVSWSPDAKMRAHLIAVSCIKAAQSPFRAVYDDARARYDGAVHAEPCRRCGPSGRPAEAGSPLSAGHQHARALRLVSKELPRALWVEARRIHGLTVEEAA